MKCFEHEEKDAVAQCGSCSVGLCKECVTDSTFTYENKPLCKKCNIEITSTRVKEHKKTKRKLKNRIILNSIFGGIGLIFLIMPITAFLSSSENTKIIKDGISLCLFFWSLTAIVPSFRLCFSKTNPKKEERAPTASDIVHEANKASSLSYTLIYYLMKLLVWMILFEILILVYAVMLPIRIALQVSSFKKTKTQLKEDEAILEKLSAQ